MAKDRRSYNVCDSSSYESNSSDDESVYGSKNNDPMTNMKRSTSSEEGMIPLKKIKRSPSSSDCQDYPDKFPHNTILQDYTKFNKDNISTISSKLNCTRGYQKSKRKTSEKGQRCHSRNAIMARMNRLKKKQYVETLENDITKVTQENADLKRTVTSQSKSIKALKNRVNYLEGVLANSRELGMLLKTVKKATGLPTIISLGKSGPPQPAISTDSATGTGFPPPQPDHIYSKTPDVSSTIVTGSMSPTGKDNLINVANSFLLDEQLSPLLSDDVSLPLLPIEDPKSFDGFPDSVNSDNSYLLDYPEYNQPFDFENFDDDHLTSGVGICLHIAKKRVSLEFCQSCNNNSVAAWDENIFADG